jgi:hypothetical protein
MNGLEIAALIAASAFAGDRIWNVWFNERDRKVKIKFSERRLNIDEKQIGQPIEMNTNANVSVRQKR